MYIKEKYRKLCLLLGFVGTALFAVGDVLLQNFEDSGETFLYMIKPTIAEQPMWQLYFVLLTGVIAAPLMWLGLCAMHSHIADNLNERKSKMLMCYDIAAVTGSLTFFAAHSVCAVLMMSVKNALECGITPEQIDAVYGTSFLLSFAVTNVWVTVQGNYRSSEGNVCHEHSRRFHHFSPCRKRTHGGNGKRNIHAAGRARSFPRHRADVCRGMLCEGQNEELNWQKTNSSGTIKPGAVFR